MVYGRFSQVVGRLPEFSLMRSHNGAKKAVVVITFHFSENMFSFSKCGSFSKSAFIIKIKLFFEIF